MDRGGRTFAAGVVVLAAVVGAQWPATVAQERVVVLKAARIFDGHEIGRLAS